MFFTKDGTPFVVTPMVCTLPCRIPVLPGGDGAETEPLESRTATCSHPAYVLIGTGAVCGHHLEQFFRVAGTELPAVIARLAAEPEPEPIDDLQDYGQHGEPCWYAGHVPGCACRAGGDVELRPGWISYEQDGQTIEVEVAP
jgi:hypothetical protein